MFTQYVCNRGFSSVVISRKESKFGRMMTKLIARDTKKRPKQWYVPIFPTASIMETNNKPGRKSMSAHPSKRSSQVASVMYQYISHIMSSGELHPLLADKGIHILKVTVTEDISAINVSWQATGACEEDEALQKLMDQNVAKLRSMLTSLRLLSQIPRIHFIKDMCEVNVQKVQELLCIADFGNFHEPSTSPNSMKCVNKKFIKNGRKMLVDVDYNKCTDDQQNDISILSMSDRCLDIYMKHTIYGLNHNELMDKLSVSMNKSLNRLCGGTN